MRLPKLSVLSSARSFVATPLLLGLGSTGGRDVIHPAVDFHATLVDRDGTTVEVNRLNIGGDVQLEGDMGRGTLRIAFDNIKRIELERQLARLQHGHGAAEERRARSPCGCATR